MTEAPDAAGGSRRRLPRARRITSGNEIRTLFQRGKRSRTPHLDVFASPSPLLHPRAGVIVPRHRHAVVERNLLKRRLREVVRTEVLPRLDVAGRASDVLIRARREAYDASFAQLREELSAWTDRHCSRDS